MKTCTFFGHRDTSQTVVPVLKSAIVDLIENEGVRRFYVGNNGSFDRIVKHQLSELQTDYPIDFAVVLAYIPDSKSFAGEQDSTNTILPDGIESVPRKFAISYRNKKKDSLTVPNQPSATCFPVLPPQRSQTNLCRGTRIPPDSFCEESGGIYDACYLSLGKLQSLSCVAISLPYIILIIYTVLSSSATR